MDYRNLPSHHNCVAVELPKKKKCVHYSRVCYVVLIPTRQEFKDAGLDLWYRFGEYDCGFNDDIDELEEEEKSPSKAPCAVNFS